MTTTFKHESVAVCLGKHTDELMSHKEHECPLCRIELLEAAIRELCRVYDHYKEVMATGPNMDEEVITLTEEVVPTIVAVRGNKR